MHKKTLKQRWANVTLRSKITGATVLILFFGILVAGIGTVSLLRPALYANHDTELQKIQSDPVSSLRPGASQTGVTKDDVVYAPGRNYVAMFNNKGEFLFDNRSAVIHGSNGVDAVPNLEEQVDIKKIIEHALHARRGQNDPANEHNIIELTAPDGKKWRAITTVVQSPVSSEVAGVLVFASSTALIENVLTQYAIIFACFGFGVILLGAAVTRILVSATFEPLVEVERTAREIARGDFSKRITVAAPSTEVGHVGTSLNVMLDTMQEAFDDRDKTIEQMRRFVGDAGHELRTPLTSVRGYAEMYRMGAYRTDSEMQMAMQRIESEAIRMTSLVEDLLSLARLDSSRELVMVPLNLNALARDAAMDALAQDPERDIMSVPSPDVPYALGDEHKIRQVMTNLMANAIRHTPQGSPIEIAVIATPSCARFEIRDHGEGVPEQIRDRIFDRFWRADTSRNRETGGSGLGLAIVNSIVSAHKGTVSCHASENGSGATFRVDLPYAQPSVDRENTQATDAATIFEQDAAERGVKPANRGRHARGGGLFRKRG
ncbi:MAG: HAMP domain-containing sensor histidine kinase [Microbacteriaceae bacterium]|nr:HAMP domain-containing sensor histidine kinase [Microbacteriaceae bacterium]